MEYSCLVIKILFFVFSFSALVMLNISYSTFQSSTFSNQICLTHPFYTHRQVGPNPNHSSRLFLSLSSLLVLRRTSGQARRRLSSAAPVGKLATAAAHWAGP